jgi:hypothetical protein
VLEMQHWRNITSFAEGHLTDRLPTLRSWRWWSFSHVITIGEVWHHYSLEMKMESMVWKNSMFPAEEEFQTSGMWYNDSLLIPLLRIIRGHVLQSLSLHGWAIGLGSIFLTHRTALTWPFQTFACLANWQHTFEVLDFYLVTLSKPGSRSGFKSRMFILIAMGLESFSVCFYKCLNKFGYSRKIKDWCPNITICFSCLHLPPVT